MLRGVHLRYQQHQGAQAQHVRAHHHVQPRLRLDARLDAAQQQFLRGQCVQLVGANPTPHKYARTMRIMRQYTYTYIFMIFCCTVAVRKNLKEKIKYAFKCVTACYRLFFLAGPTSLVSLNLNAISWIINDQFLFLTST